MNWLPMMMNLLGTSGVGGASGTSQDSGSFGQFGQGSQQMQQGQQQWGQESLQQGPQQMQQMNQAMEYGTVGTPPSLQAALAQNQPMHQTPEANFSSFYQPAGDGMVLPPREPMPQGMPIAPAGIPQQSTIRQPVGQNTPPQLVQPQQPQQSGWSSLFNPIGSMPASANSQQQADPNMFLRMSEGYNRGGLMGALGMLLTDFNQ